jgi:glucosylceramidase
MKPIYWLSTLAILTISFSSIGQIWISQAASQQMLHEQVLTSVPVGKAGIQINPEEQFQTIDGFGYTLTGGSSQLILALAPAKQKALLTELFGTTKKSMGISVLRIAVGASDLDANVFTYDDVPAGQKDDKLEHFSLKASEKDLIPLMQAIKKINPSIKFMATPWSPPAWMKDNQVSKGGSLLPQYYGVYAEYLVKYLKSMEALGLPFDYLTPQNEPLHPGNNPSLLMLASQENEFIKNHLGLAFKKAGLKTKILAYDHNCDKPEYPIEILNDPITRQFVAGSAFHLYNGDISALSVVRKAHPDKEVYFTEQWTGAKGEFAGDFNWHIKNVIIGSLVNDAKTALEWNLANDPQWGPHTPGGCTECKGALTIGSDGQITRNQAYYIIAQASKFIPTGSIRIALNQLPKGMIGVAALRPDKQVAVLLQNETQEAIKTSISLQNRHWEIEVPKEGVVSVLLK